MDHKEVEVMGSKWWIIPAEVLQKPVYVNQISWLRAAVLSAAAMSRDIIL